MIIVVVVWSGVRRSCLRFAVGGGGLADLCRADLQLCSSVGRDLCGGSMVLVGLWGGMRLAPGWGIGKPILERAEARPPQSRLVEV